MDLPEPCSLQRHSFWDCLRILGDLVLTSDCHLTVVVAGSGHDMAQGEHRTEGLLGTAGGSEWLDLYQKTKLVHDNILIWLSLVLIFDFDFVVVSWCFQTVSGLELEGYI